MVETSSMFGEYDLKTAQKRLLFSRLEELINKSFKIMSRSESVKSTSETFKSIPICQICASDGNVAIVNKRMNARFFCCCKNAQFASPFFAMELQSIWKLGKLTMFAASIGSVAQSYNSFLNWAQFRAHEQSHNLFLDVSWTQIKSWDCIKFLDTVRWRSCWVRLIIVRENKRKPKYPRLAPNRLGNLKNIKIQFSFASLENQQQINLSFIPGAL